MLLSWDENHKSLIDFFILGLFPVINIQKDFTGILCNDWKGHHQKALFKVVPIKDSWMTGSDWQLLIFYLLYRYKIDFELFGYDAEDYIKMGKPGLDDLSDEVKVEKKEEKTEVVSSDDSIKKNGDEVHEIQSDEKPMTADE